RAKTAAAEVVDEQEGNDADEAEPATTHRQGAAAHTAAVGYLTGVEGRSSTKAHGGQVPPERPTETPDLPRLRPPGRNRPSRARGSNQRCGRRRARAADAPG